VTSTTAPALSRSRVPPASQLAAQSGSRRHRRVRGGGPSGEVRAQVPSVAALSSDRQIEVDPLVQIDQSPGVSKSKVCCEGSHRGAGRCGGGATTSCVRTCARTRLVASWPPCGRLVGVRAAGRAVGRGPGRRCRPGGGSRPGAASLTSVRPHVRNGRSESSLRNAESSGRNSAVRKPTVARGRGDQVS
jgi:hypothetical protein